VTSDLSRVGGNVGLVTLRNKTVFKIIGPQSGGLTAQERADMLTKRLQIAAHRLSAPSASDISVAPVPQTVKPAPLEAKSAAAETTAKPADVTAAADTETVSDAPQQILVGTTTIITVDPAQAQAAGYRSAAELANAWAKNVRIALGLPPTVTPPATVAPATPSATVDPPAPTATPPPAAPAGGG
jgi:hypothetical protein